jgi:hypothetical protein
MTLSPLRRALAATVTALAAVSGPGWALPPPDPEQVQLDQTVQQLRQEVLRINAEAQAVEDALRYPPMTRTDVLFGVAVSQLLVREIRLQIEDRPVVTETFSEATASALLRSGGLQRVMRANLEPGAYTLKVEVEGQYADAEADAEPLRLEQTARIEKTLAPLLVQIELAPERSNDRRSAAGFFRRGGPSLQVRSGEDLQP